MATFNKINSFVEDLAEKVHNLGSDQLAVALTAAANAPVATNTVLANLTQIVYTNLSSRNVTTSGVSSRSTRAARSRSSTRSRRIARCAK